MRTKLYLIPGTMCNDALWSEMLPHLHVSFELVYLTIPTNKSFDELAQHYHDTLPDEAINLVGFSLGGYIATYFAMLFPKRVKKLFVISNSPTSLPEEELRQRHNTLEYVESNGYSGMSKLHVANMLEDAGNKSVIDTIVAMGRALGEEALISQYRYTMDRLDLSKAIAQFSFSTHFYFSCKDKMVNQEWLEKLGSLTDRVKLLDTEGKGHMLPLEKPQELANYLNQWAAI